MARDEERHMKRRRESFAAGSEAPYEEKAPRVQSYLRRLRVRLRGRGCSPFLLLLLLEYPLLSAVKAYHFPGSRSLRALQSGEAPSVSNASPEPTPTLRPTPAPTINTPTAFPTPINMDKKRFSQSFEVGNNTFFTDDEQAAVEQLFEGYTLDFAPANETYLVTTRSTFLAQRFTFLAENITTVYECIIDYSMEYQSISLNVTGYADMFMAYMNDNLGLVSRDLQGLGLDITQTMEAQFVQVETTGPTATAVPSVSPPTVSPRPTSAPPTKPTNRPSILTFPPTTGPSEATVPPNARSVALPIIVPVTVLSGMAVLIAIVLFRKSKASVPNVTRSKRRRHRYGGGKNGSNQFGKQDPATAEQVIVSRINADDNISLVSDGDESGASRGSARYSVDETKNLQDEFDSYRDQNLEDLRVNVEGNLSGFEGVMSAAMTKALMGDEDVDINRKELSWGCPVNPTGTEVEASALVEVIDWLKRNDAAPVERRRAFMQHVLNKMVTSVRFGVIDADDASRTIHESAVLLGLQVVNELPMTTVIISGMRKTVASRDVYEALSEFGDIDSVAVASGNRGFGIVRFRHPKSVDRAMRRYRNAEIVVQDVAVQLKVLMPSGEILSKA